MKTWGKRQVAAGKGGGGEDGEAMAARWEALHDQHSGWLCPLWYYQTAMSKFQDAIHAFKAKAGISDQI